MGEITVSEPVLCLSTVGSADRVGPMNRDSETTAAAASSSRVVVGPTTTSGLEGSDSGSNIVGGDEGINAEESNELDGSDRSHDTRTEANDSVIITARERGNDHGLIRAAQPTKTRALSFAYCAALVLIVLTMKSENNRMDRLIRRGRGNVRKDLEEGDYEKNTYSYRSGCAHAGAGSNTGNAQVRCAQEQPATENPDNLVRNRKRNKKKDKKPYERPNNIPNPAKQPSNIPNRPTKKPNKKYKVTARQPSNITKRPNKKQKPGKKPSSSSSRKPYSRPSAARSPSNRKPDKKDKKKDKKKKKRDKDKKPKRQRVHVTDAAAR